MKLCIYPNGISYLDWVLFILNLLPKTIDLSWTSYTHENNCERSFNLPGLLWEQEKNQRVFKTMLLALIIHVDAIFVDRFSICSSKIVGGSIVMQTYHSRVFLFTSNSEVLIASAVEVYKVAIRLIFVLVKRFLLNKIDSFEYLLSNPNLTLFMLLCFY